MSRVRVAPAAKLPPPGTAAVELFCCDLRNADGRRAVREVCGQLILEQLLEHGAPFATVAVGLGGRVVMSIANEAEFIDVGSHVIDCAEFLPGPIVILPFGVARELRDRLIDSARRRDFEMAPAEGNA